MPVVASLLFGWPAILIFTTLATIGAWHVRVKESVLALFFSLGPSLYLIGANNWIRFMGLYILLSIGISTALIRKRKPVIARFLLVPIYCFYIWFGIMLAAQ